IASFSGVFSDGVRRDWPELTGQDPRRLTDGNILPMRLFRSRAGDGTLIAGLALAGLVAMTPVFTAWAGHRSADEARPRVEHHLHQVDLLSQHFSELLTKDCQRFDRPDEWQAFLDGELDRATLLMAHLEQAWAEAKHTPDKDVRRSAKTP